MKLAFGATVKYLMGLVMVCALVFLPAGSLGYLNGWLFIGLLFVPMLLLGLVLLFNSPELLKKRLDAKEKQATQRGAVALSGLLFVVGFVVAGLDFRFGWSDVPSWAVAVSSAVLLISYALYAEVMRENEYLSRTVEIQEGQRVVDTGLYSVVRHPMYAVTIWLFLAMPVVLGSWWSLACFLPYIPIIAVRAINEEKLLAAELDGYADYMKKVKYRLIPFIW